MGTVAQTGLDWPQPEITPACAFQVFGMRRSGNHAIIDWLMRNAPDGATGGVFYNNCRHGKDPLSAYASLDIYDGQRNMLPHGDIPDARRVAGAGSAPMIVVSYEDRMPAPEGRPQRASQNFTDASFTRKIVIYRSFLNWTASLLAKIKRNDGYGATDRLRIMTLAFATYIQGLDRISDAKDIVAICYDDWMVSERYRAGRLEVLGLAAHDLGLGKVQRYGGGSSFQAKARDAQELQSTTRDADMADDPEYLLLLWTAAHDLRFMERLIVHFEEDAERLATLAESSRVNITLPMRKVAA
ncbi:hypothetical protein [uncultured Sulfitobacter sp.]|uniref:hypothetical protein n=1 Tax=uncultured Sulfitobacter sp. TaxID=191468 RepID=UPI002621B22A|nr:hypothetical protein [uncultured Sulfitobacter sp.]